jgi:hypothetical protein
MRNRLGYIAMLSLLGACSLSACGDDDPANVPDDGNGGEGGEPSGSAGTKTAGSPSGGSAGHAGSSNGGADAGGAGGAGGEPSEGGEPSTGGVPSHGGANEGGAGGSAAGGEGGAGEPSLVYTCKATTLDHKLCSALAAAECTDPTDCSTCVAERKAEREDFATGCATCDALYDDYFQCAIDAFESGEVGNGVECIEDYGADINYEKCVVPGLGAASDCQSYIQTNDCPATWPPN